MKDVLPWVGGIGTAIAAILAAYAALKARGVDDKTATREETQQALDAQGTLLDRYEARIEVLERQINAIRKTAEDAIAARNEMRQIHRDCERSLARTIARLKMAEDKIVKLQEVNRDGGT